MSPVKEADDVRELLDREAVRDVLHRSALANDTCDVEMWKSTYWPDGFEDHGNFRDSVRCFPVRI